MTVMTEPKYRKQIDAWIDAHQEEMLEDLFALVRIPSMRGKAEEGMPYGEEPARVLEAMRKLMEKYGLDTRNYENYCVTGDFHAEKEKTLDILAHLDVVPVTDTWTKTKPFEPVVEGDMIYGRGTSDDKGPAVAALYALRAIRELGIPLTYGVRLICGSDEECGSSDLKYYYSKEEEAKYTFTPDADFPLINIEKGRLANVFTAEGEQESCADAAFRVLNLHAGDKVNVIPGKAQMELTGAEAEILTKAAEETGKETGTSITVKQEGDRSIIEVSGKTGHAAHPEGGVNALTALLALLKKLPLAERAGEDMLLAIAGLWPHGDWNGKALGVDYADEESGELTMSLNVLNYEVKNDAETAYVLAGCFDCRAPICANDENLTKKVLSELARIGITMKDDPMTPVHHVPADSELVTKLLESYELYFGVKGEPIAIGGGTYVHELKRGVAFGCAEPDVDNRMHGDDEFMKLSILMKSAKIFADAVIRLCG